MNLKTRWATAYHEAGHAVVSWLLGIALRREGVTIVPDNAAGNSGSCATRWTSRKTIEWDASERNRFRAEKDIQCLLAAEIAQWRYNPHSMRRYHSSSDRKQMDDLLTRFYLRPKRDRRMGEAATDTHGKPSL